MTDRQDELHATYEVHVHGAWTILSESMVSHDGFAYRMAIAMRDRINETVRVTVRNAPFTDGPVHFWQETIR